MSGFSRGGGGAIRVKETDGSPSIDAVTEVRLPADMLVDVGGGVVSLPLGTAALSDTGTSAGNVPVLATGGKYPAIDGSLITNISGGGSALTVQDADGTPIDTAVNTIKFPNGAVTVDSAGVVSIDKYPAPSGIDGPALNAFSGNLRAGWTFNDAGAPIDDSVGVNYQLALQSGSPSYLETGKNGTSVSLAGAIFSRPSAGWSPGTGSWTINTWVYQTAYGSYPFFFQWSNGTSTSHTFYLRNNGQVTWGATGAAWAEVGSFIPYLNKWTMITWKRTFTAPSTYLHEVYLDGAFFASYDNAALPDDLNTYSLDIGGNGSVHKQDEVLFWNEAISPAAIAELYNSGTGLFLTTIGAPTGLGFSHADLVNYNSYLHDYWKFEESGTPLIDSISNNSLAATGSPAFGATGKNGNCLDFNSATPDYLSRVSTFAHTTTQEYTLSYWVYVDALGVIQHFHQFHTPAYTSMIEQVHIGTAGELYHFRKWWTGGADNQAITAPTTFTAATWHHIVVVKAQVGAAYQWSLYLDGVHQGSDTANASNTSQNTATSTFYVGRVGDISNMTLDGKIDEMAYWKGTALDSAAVTALYNAGSGRFLESV